MERITTIMEQDLEVVDFAVKTYEGYAGKVWLKAIFELDEEELLNKLKEIACKCTLSINEIIGFEIHENYSTIIFSMEE